MDFGVTYTNHGGPRKYAVVSTHAKQMDGQLWYYAKNLDVFGCGKDHATPEGAVRRLVNDHGQVIEVRPLPDHTLYTDADSDRPESICDRNGQVVLGMCKVCKRAEIELSEPCEPPDPSL
jgi:hypothetical protein